MIRNYLSYQTLRIMIPFCLAFLLGMFAQNLSTIIGQDPNQELVLQHQSLVVLVSAFFLAFAMFQVPLGLLLDYFNPAKIEAFFLLIAAVGAFLIQMAETLETLTLGRVIMGIGISACLVSAYRAIYDQFSTAQIPLFNSIVVAFGGLGMIISGWPHLVDYAKPTAWRDIFFVLAFLFPLCGLLLYFCIPKPIINGQDAEATDKPEEPKPSVAQPTEGLLAGIAVIIRTREFWLIMPTLASIQGLLLSITNLWIIPWLLVMEGFTEAQLPIMLIIVSLVLTIGYLLSGWLGYAYGGKYEAMHKLFLVGSIGAVSALMMICFVPKISSLALWSCFMLLAPFSALGFPILMLKIRPTLVGRAVTTLSVCIFLTAFIFQWLTNFIISMSDAAPSKIILFSYRLGFSIPATLCLIAIISLVILRLNIFEKSESR